MNDTVIMEEELDMLQKKESKPEILRVCFVCTGNTCRSPMAEAVARALAKKHAGSRRLEVMSAGLYANEGEPISANAVRALEMRGIEADAGKDYHSHRAHTLTAEEAERADLLIGMTGGHCTELLMCFPDAAQKIMVMPHPVSDPYGGDLACYRFCLNEIFAGVSQLLFPHEKKEGEGTV